MIRTVALCALVGAILAVLSELAFGSPWPGYVGAAVAGFLITRRRFAE